MMDEEREIARLRAIELLNGIADQVDEIENDIPDLCRQVIFEGQDMSAIIGAVKESLLLRQTHETAKVHFEALVLPDSTKNNRQLFFEALEEITQQQTVTAHDIELLEKLVISSGQVANEALQELKRSVAH